MEATWNYVEFIYFIIIVNIRMNIELSRDSLKLHNKITIIVISTKKLNQ